MAGIETRADRLRAFIDAVKNKPCEWGKDDCTAWAATWVREERGIDLGLPAYDEASGRQMIAQPGALIRLWSEKLSLAGIPETDFPDLGDVAIIETREFGAVGSIVCPNGIVFWRSQRGVLPLKPRKILKAWAV